jgi:predicted MFS family arabinose efflux permease
MADGLLALGITGFCAFLGMHATQPLLPLLGRVFEVSKAGAALTVSAPPIAVALVSPFVGAVADRLGRRRVVTASLFALAVPTVLAATAPGLPALVAWRFAQGVAMAGVYAGAIAYAATVWQGGGAGRAMASLVTGNLLGGLSGRLLAGFAADHGGWRFAFVVLGAVTAVGALGAWRWLPPVVRTPADGQRPLAALRALYRHADAQLLITFVIGFNVLFTLTATFTYVTFHLAAPPFGLGPTGLSCVFLVYLGGALVTPTAGRWIDRLDPRRVVTYVLGGAVLGCPLMLVPSLWAVVLGLVLCCASVSVSQAAATTHLQSAAPVTARSMASGVYLSCYYLGGAVGGVLPAGAWRFGGWPACVALVAAVQLVTIALARRFWTLGPPPQSTVGGGCA